MLSWKRTIENGRLRPAHIGQKVVLNGWVHRYRDHGGIIFLDLRDRTGLVQVVVDPAVSDETHRIAGEIRNEFVLVVEGRVRNRPEGTVNPKLATGEVEILADRIEVLNTCRTLPFSLSDEEQMADVNEELRIKYRYLDLRRPAMYERLELRHRVITLIREFLNRHNFLEIETPILTKSTPEGARDYVVPYRLRPGCFYALPQSPQQYKQLLMVGGIERYYQIARCFRDEAQRADRQPEFTQLDLEMSFVEQDDILNLMEALTIEVVQQVSTKKITIPFPRLTYDQAIDRYGTDKPDMRFELQLVDCSDSLRSTEFSVFQRALSEGGQVKALRYPGGSDLSRKEIDDLTELAKSQGSKGLAYLIVTAVGVKSPIAKYLNENEIHAILDATGAVPGDMICFAAGDSATVANVLGRLRLEIGSRLVLRDPHHLCFVWITDFPLVEWNDEEKRWDAMHHMFTMPHPEDLPLFGTNPAAIRAQCYDIVCNGVEWASGSIRIHRCDIQQRVFELLGIDEGTQRERFGHMLDAFELGAPPHGGIAPGIDRLVMFLSDDENIREVMAFPKMGQGADPMMDAPAPLDPLQLQELHLQIIPPNDEPGKRH